MITQGLVKLGLLKGKVAALIKDRGVPAVFQSSHRSLAGPRRARCRRLQSRRRVAGAGARAWCSPSSPASTFGRRRAYPKEFWNIGIRIEDEVLVTDGAAGGADGGAREDAGRDRGAGAGGLMQSAAIPSFDIAIVGGGMVGASLAVALAPLGLEVALHRGDSARFRRRSPASMSAPRRLSNGSRRILETTRRMGRRSSASATRSARSMSRIRAASALRASMRPNRVSPPWAMWCRIARWAAALWARLHDSPERSGLLSCAKCPGVTAHGERLDRIWRSPRPAARRQPRYQAGRRGRRRAIGGARALSGSRRSAATMSKPPSSPRCCRSDSTITWRTRDSPTAGRWRCCRSTAVDAPWY